MLIRNVRSLGPIATLLALSLSGCQSPYHSDQGALTGGLLGAGTGAIIGHALGNTGAGAAIGAGVGALSGAAIGNGMDEMEARNRAEIEARMGRQIAAGAVTVPGVVEMTRAGVAEELIINQLRYRGLAAPIQTNDVIHLQQQGVSGRVIATMQATQVATVQTAQPVQPVAVPVYPEPGPAIIVEQRWGPPCRRHHW